MLGKWTEWNSSKPLFFTVSVMLSFLSRGPWRDVAGARGSPAASGCWVVGQQVRGETSGCMAAATHPERSLSSVCPGDGSRLSPFHRSLNMILHTQGLLPTLAPLSLFAWKLRRVCLPSSLPWPSWQGHCAPGPCPARAPVCSACPCAQPPGSIPSACLHAGCCRRLTSQTLCSELCCIGAPVPSACYMPDCSPVSRWCLPLALLYSRGLLPSHPPAPSKLWTGIISKPLVIL